MATNKIPLLMLSATCRPIAVDSILRNLKLQPTDIKMIEGELTRPEIRIIRVTMDHPLKSADDLLKIYAPHTATSANEIVPTLIYSGTRNATFQVMKVINEARKTKLHEYDPNDKFIRRFHSCTGDSDKLLNMDDFTNGLYPVISTTMALGLGQNLKRVRCVIHLGRGDPSSIVQMVGRCGRGGNGGLALLFVEPVRKSGKNCVEDFDADDMGGDDTRMDSLAVTPLCLRVGLTCDNK
jgi:superfamily II DNA helicase RecQ